MASFQAKIGWKMLRKREYKKYRSVSFLPDAKSKIQKLKKYHYGFCSSQNRSEKDAKERKQKSSLRFVPTRRVIENSKKIAKNFKKLKKFHFGFISSQNRMEKAEKERK